MKKYLIKLKRTLLYRRLRNHYFLITLGLVLFLLLILKFNIWFLIINILFYVILLLYEFRFIFVCLFLFIIVSINVLINNYHYNKIDYGDIVINAEVVNIDKTTNGEKITIKSNHLKYIFYDDSYSLNIGDEINIEGYLECADINHSDYLFNYRNYLRYNNILGIIKDFKYNIVDHHLNINSLNKMMINYFNLHFEGQTRGYLQALVIGYKDNLGDDLMSNIKDIGISHLFVISGLHMNIVMMILIFLLKLCHIPKKIHFIIILVFFIIYYIITGGLISILRVLLVYVLTSCNKRFNLHLSTIDIYMTTILMVFTISPFYIFNYSFLLTFIISTSLVYISPLLKVGGFIGFLRNNILISINSIIVTLPIIISINPEINILSILYNLFYIPLVSYIILPFSILTSIMPFLDFIYEPIINVFTNITSLLSNINIFNISLSKVNIVICTLYYGVYLYIVTILKYKRYKHLYISIPILSTLFFMMSNVRFLDIYQRIVFMDLPQGESTIILDSHNKTNILVDTGEDMGDDLILYLMNIGVKRLDYVFITHGDSDHNGKLPELISKFKIHNIVINKYDSDTLKLCSNNSYKGNIIKVKRGDYLKYHNMEFKILLPDYDTNDKNNNSIVMIATLFNTKILFLGDIEEKQEKHLINLERKINVDIIKVPHHGSKTSSTQFLLNNITYNYAICMSGYKNTFGFPVNFVINRYNNKCLTTSTYYTITLYKRSTQNKLKIKYANSKK